MTDRKRTTTRKTTTPEPPKRTSVSELAKLLAERRSAGASSVTVKTSAQGVLMPEITVVANEDDATITAMTKQAIDAYASVLAALTTPSSGD